MLAQIDRPMTNPQLYYINKDKKPQKNASDQKPKNTKWDNSQNSHISTPEVDHHKLKPKCVTELLI